MRKLSILLSIIILPMAVALPASASTQQFVGVWKAEGKKGDIQIEQLEIKPDGPNLSVQAKGKCKKCDFGKSVGIPYAPHPRNNLAQAANAVTAQFDHNGKKIVLVIRAAGNNSLSVEYFEIKDGSGEIAVTQTFKKN